MRIIGGSDSYLLDRPYKGYLDYSSKPVVPNGLRTGSKILLIPKACALQFEEEFITAPNFTTPILLLLELRSFGFVYFLLHFNVFMSDPNYV